MTAVRGISRALPFARYSADAAFAMPAAHAPAAHRFNANHWAGVLLTVLLLAWSGHARAACVTFDYHTGTVSFPSATITLPPNPPPGFILWTSPPTPVVNPLQGNCTGTIPNGLANQMGGAASPGDDTLFPTSVAGLSYRILFMGNNGFTNAPGGIRAYPNQPSGSGAIAFSGNAQLQLVITNPAAFASANPTSISGPVALWKVDGYLFIFFGTGDAVRFSASAITFVTPACAVVSGNIAVQLPDVLSSQFTGVNQSTGTPTLFHIELNCSRQSPISVTLAASNAAVQTGVINSTGTAAGVGVQLLDDNGNPVSFGTPFAAGTAQAGTFSIPLYARYYQTGASVSGGSVTATATYTVTYQ